ncbi:hypothetical protein LZ30DRAFT_692923 [Colletotrichum cereale]|nr:hypothetical protein LZ30DRAFT_692923 [Colletotrichum cereale]
MCLFSQCTDCYSVSSGSPALIVAQKVVYDQVAGASGMSYNCRTRSGGYEFFKKRAIDLVGLDAVYSISRRHRLQPNPPRGPTTSASSRPQASTPGFATSLVGGFSKIPPREALAPPLSCSSSTLDSACLALP